MKKGKTGSFEITCELIMPVIDVIYDTHSHLHLNHRNIEIITDITISRVIIHWSINVFPCDFIHIGVVIHSRCDSFFYWMEFFGT